MVKKIDLDTNIEKRVLPCALFNETEPIDFDLIPKINELQEKCKKNQPQLECQKERLTKIKEVLRDIRFIEDGISKIKNKTSAAIRNISQLIIAENASIEVKKEVDDFRKKTPFSVTFPFFEGKEKSILSNLDELGIFSEKLNRAVNSSLLIEIYKEGVDRIKERLKSGEEIYVQIMDERCFDKIGRLLEVEFVRGNENVEFKFSLSFIDRDGATIKEHNPYKAMEISKNIFEPRQGYLDYLKNNLGENE